ncbi:hypothetical protein CHS0354_013513 [Potamilus streckersoni]|uniref:RRM domain-containing protein n=1 Tax=Potamilus streckersoni TaxID=2493646 RepID=A0AAE0W8U2_9BIVA|nr:hypothetical protein CHS0354_013513 [Potamilus streckersoni]
MADVENGHEADDALQDETTGEFDAEGENAEQFDEGADGDTGAAGHEESALDDPELEAIKARVREMEEEAEKLKEMQSAVDEQMNMKSPTLSAFPTVEEKIEADGRSIYVGNVDYQATAEELEQHFHGCGSINRVTIQCDKFSGHPKGFAYVEFADKDSVATAMALDESLFRGRQIKVCSKRTNRPGLSTTNRPPRSRFRRRGGFYGFSPRPRTRGRYRRATYYSPY